MYLRLWLRLVIVCYCTWKRSLKTLKSTAVWSPRSPKSTGAEVCTACHWCPTTSVESLTRFLCVFQARCADGCASSIEVLRWGFAFHHGQQISQSRNGDRGKVVLWCHFASRTLFDHGSRSSMFILINCLWYHPLESCNNFSWLAPAMLASYSIKSL